MAAPKDLALFDMFRRLAESYGSDVRKVLATAAAVQAEGRYVPELVDDLTCLLAKKAGHVGRFALDQMSLAEFMGSLGR